MKTIIQKIWENTDSITKWLQVTALIFAAIWTYFTFRITQEGGLQTPLDVGANLSFNWRPTPEPGSCWVTNVVNVKNDGVKSFVVGRVRLTNWRKDIQSPVGQPQFLNFPELEKSAPASVITPQSLLITLVAPKVNIHDAFTWIINDRPPSGLYIFRVDIEDQKGAVLGSAAAWTDRLCQ